MSQIINSFNFRWDQPSEQNHESGQDLSFNFAFSCKTSFCNSIFSYKKKEPNSSPTFAQLILIKNPSRSTINIHSESVYYQYSFRTSLPINVHSESVYCQYSFRISLLCTIKDRDYYKKRPAGRGCSGSQFIISSNHPSPVPIIHHRLQSPTIGSNRLPSALTVIHHVVDRGRQLVSFVFP